MTITTYEVPVLIKVTVERDSSTGEIRVAAATADNECAPWGGSSEPVAWEVNFEQWHEGFGDPDIEAVWEGAYQWLEHHDLVNVARAARMQAMSAAALRMFSSWPGHARQDGLLPAYRTANAALSMIEQTQRDPFRFYLRRLPANRVKAVTP